ncbi:excinuclease ABC subunit A [Phaeocystidibacter luteus]|uniref:UvrABC system protein A n=2 Tax=Phaeocystidibacter luteus TaxID=911197 RepID=A0A6N6RE21_9FLAO|nr:excinuclease ABC subunit A [Phaeocystidibacter luteus]
MPNVATKPIETDENIVILGARVHNLKNIDLTIPRNKLVVITGVSGSGKSSLAFDTLYAEGQRRYVESLSSYARQFLGRLNKPEVDDIKGLAPAIAIEQKVISRNPRSTVGTTTEIYDYLKVLFARIGRTVSPVSGEEVKRHSVADVLKHLHAGEAGERLMITSPVRPNGRTAVEALNVFVQQGFSRIWWDKEAREIPDLIEEHVKDWPLDAELIIDRAVVRHDDEDNDSRLADSIQTAFFEGHGVCHIHWVQKDVVEEFSNKFEADGIQFEEPSLHLFSFNNPYGACPKCEGFGNVIGIDEDLVIPNHALSIYEDAVAAWKGDSMQEWKDELVRNASKFDFPIHRAYGDLTDEQREELWNGNKYFRGINKFFKHLESKSYKIQYRVMLSRYRGKTKCPECNGRRLRKDAGYVHVDGKNIMELVDLSMDKLHAWFENVNLTEFEQKVAKRLLIEITNRLHYLREVGLGYLTLNRLSSTLSGGESQRINLATSMGSSLVGSMYILDEPSIGLHPRDTDRLVKVVQDLRDLGNTVIVVEHDEAFMKAADFIVDIGPGAGSYGGEIQFNGSLEELLKSDTLTAKYLNGTKEIELPKVRRESKYKVVVEGARENNLKNIDIEFPLHTFTVVTGVSGSGKSTLIRRILYPMLQKQLGGYGEKAGKHKNVEGDISRISGVEFVDQNPIGKSSRSNPVTYLKAYDEIRNLYASQKLSQLSNLKAKHFSFNTDGGRCDVCKGEGEVTIEMQFMADVHLKCEQCDGKRFKDEVLEVQFEGKNIFDILELTVDDAIAFFEEHGQKKIVNRLKPLQEVGLGYVHLGQSSSTLSGGEAQRVKLASFLVIGQSEGKKLFIFDEPTTGLHFEDIHKLLNSFYALIEKGHSILVIEHNPDVIKCADWLIDLGPEGGENGGNLLYCGKPEGILELKDNSTADAIRDKM